jgi:hypothetical protein
LQTEIDRLKAQLTDDNNPTWKARYQSLQGMFNAEKVRHASEIEELKKQPPVQTDPEQFAVLEEEVGTKTAAILKPYLETIAQLQEQLVSVKSDVKDTKGRFESTQLQNDEERLLSNLNTLVPNWKKINGWPEEGIPQDPRFTAFAFQKIPGTSMTYQNSLVDSYMKRDAASVAEIFTLFEKSVTPPAAIVPQSTDVDTSDVSRYVEPDKTGKGVKIPTGQEEMIPHAEYDAFTESLVKGTFKGTREERLKLEAFYDKAYAENRIR